jgi:hypothetical protein
VEWEKAHAAPYFKAQSKPHFIELCNQLSHFFVFQLQEDFGRKG